MEYFVADSYKNYERIGESFDKNGKRYIKVKSICSRCGGTGTYPSTEYDGICLCCKGNKYDIKEVRLYTKAEYDKMTEQNEHNRQKKAEAQEAKIKAEYGIKQTEWLRREGFSEDRKTYIVLGDSYAIKDQLKKEGFYYSPVLKWHRATPGEYECLEISAEEVLDFSAWGTGCYHNDAQKYVQDKIDALNPPSASEWIGEEKEKIYDLPVIVKSVRGYTNTYGYGKVYTFMNGDNVITWFTASNPVINVDDIVLLSATIKELTEYKGVKQTIINRPKFKLVE